jgi:CheY-like chemotaxis protein
MSNLTILLVEDNPTDTILVREALLHRSNYYTLDIVSTMGEALTLLKYGKYDVILLDLVLPDSNPNIILAPLITILGDLSDSYPTIVVLTGVDDLDTRLEALRMGAQGYFPKTRLEPDSEDLWNCILEASMRGSYIESLRHKGLPFTALPVRVLGDAERLIDNIIGANNG